MSISHADIDVGRLSINGRAFDSVSFRALQNSALGRLMFQQNTSLTVHQDRCQDPRGCLCGNADLRGVVCSMESTRCGRQQDDGSGARCSGGVRPKEHCCYEVCGAIVHLNTYGADVRISMLEAVAAAQTTDNKDGDKGGGRSSGVRLATTDAKESKGSPGDVDYSVSRVGENEYELVFVDRGGDIANGIAAARRVRDVLADRLEPKGAYLWLEESGVSPPSALRAAGKAFGAVLGLAAVVALLYLLGMAYLRKGGSVDSAAALLRRGREGLLEGMQGVRRRREPQGSDLPFAKFSGGRVEVGEENAVEGGIDGDDEDPRVEVLDPGTMTMRSLEEGVEAGVHRSFANPLFAASAAVEIPKEETKVEQKAEVSGGGGGDLVKLVSIEEPQQTDLNIKVSEDSPDDKGGKEGVAEKVDDTETANEETISPPDPTEPPPIDINEPEVEEEEDKENEDDMGNTLVDF